MSAYSAWDRSDEHDDCNLRTAARRRRRLTIPILLRHQHVSHLLNDVMQSLLPAIYPILKGQLRNWISVKSD